MIKKLLYIMDKNEKRQLPILLVEIIIGSILETVGISVILPVINILLDPQIVYKEGYISQLFRLGGFHDVYKFELFLLVSVVVFFVLKNIYLYLMKYHQTFFIYKGQRTLANRMMKAYLSQPYIYYTKKNIAELQRNVSADIGKCYQTVLSMLTILTQGGVAIALIIFLLISDWLITIIILGLISVTMYVFLKVTNKLNYKYGNISRGRGEKVIQWINQSFGGIKEVKLFGSECFFIKKIDEAYADSSVAESKTNMLSILPNMIMETICITAIMISTLIKLSMGGDLTKFVTVLAAFALAAIRLIPTVGNVSTSISRVTFNKASIWGIYNELKEIENNKISLYLDSACLEKLNFVEKLCVINVSFKYPEGDKYVLKDVSLNIKRGQSVAFVGPSGAGKSTLADIILGMLQPEAGSIEVDGVNINNNIKGWYKQIGYIPQSIYLMDSSIRNNVAFGIEEENIDDEKVWEALRKAQLEEFVLGLPEGINTNLGDRGIRCSGGQRQRLGIARALYDDPEFLILDEATSALDNDTERAVMKAIDSLKGKKTLLIIAHRLSTTKNCDITYKIENEYVQIVKRE